MLDALGEELAGDLLVLGARACGLRFDYYAGGFVAELNGGVGFVLWGIYLVRFFLSDCVVRWVGLYRGWMK